MTMITSQFQTMRNETPMSDELDGKLNSKLKSELNSELSSKNVGELTSEINSDLLVDLESDLNSDQNIEMSDELIIEPSGRDAYSFEAVFEQLQGVLSDYLNKHSNLSLNGLSKRCGVSEPTLRRIKKGQLKTLPNVSTIFELLCYVTGEKDFQKIVSQFSAPLSDYLKDKASQIENFKKMEFSEHLTQALKDPVKYVIYKLATGDHGVNLEKVLDLFGSYGERQLQSLVMEQLFVERDGHFFARIPSFALSHEVFVEHFKTMADFIKPHKLANAHRDYAPVFSNYSAVVNKAAYSDIIKIQRAANKKIAKILQDPQSTGKIPTFVINAVDTIDSLCADELPEES